MRQVVAAILGLLTACGGESMPPVASPGTSVEPAGIPTTPPVIAPSAPAGDLPAFPRFDVRDFGAKGDGVQDDGPFIQAASDAAGAVGAAMLHLPAGEYRVDAASVPILIASRTIVLGDGIDTTVVRTSGAVTHFHPVFRNRGWNTTAAAGRDRDIRFTGFTLDCPSDRAAKALSTTQWSGIQLANFEDARIDHVRMSNTYYMGITIQGETLPVTEERNRGLRIEDVRMEYCGYADGGREGCESIVLQNVEDAAVRRVHITDTGGAFVAFNHMNEAWDRSSAIDSSLEDFWFDTEHDPDSVGIRFAEYAARIAVSCGVILNVQGTGIKANYPGPTTDLSIAHVRLENVALGEQDEAGVRLTRTTGARLADVVIAGVWTPDRIRTGLDLAEARDATLSRVTVRRATGHGVRIRDASTDIVLKHVESLDNSRGNGALHDGFRVTADGAFIRFHACRATDSGSPKRQQYGLHLEASTGRTLVGVTAEGCDFTWNGAGDTRLSGGGTFIDISL